jgi:CHAD domain-containing protein
MTPRRVAKPFQVEWAARADVAENARTRLPKLAAAYFGEGRNLIDGNPAPADLHALRLATKKLRYTLEFFKSCYGKGLNARIDALKSLQQMLGDINDTVAAKRTIEAALGARTPDMQRVARLLRRQGQAKANEFRKHWAEVFDATGQERSWVDYLTKQAREEKREPARRASARPRLNRTSAAGRG